MCTANKRGLIWLAMATIAMAYVSCAQTSLESARAYAHPVLQFFSGEQSAAAPALPQRQAKAASLRAPDRTQASLLAAMLPVLFIGLVSPLNLLSPKSLLCLGRSPAAPQLPFRFQRPPPALFG